MPSPYTTIYQFIVDYWNAVYGTDEERSLLNQTYHSFMVNAPDYSAFYGVVGHQKEDMIRK